MNLCDDNQKWTVGWGFTARCDLKCPFCYSKGVRTGLDTPELGLSEAKQFLLRNRKHIAALNFGTGECFLSPYFPALLSLCREIIPDCQIAVTSNGAIVDAVVRNQDFLKVFASNIDELDVSLDFHQEPQHDAWRGRAGCWTRAIKAIRLGLEQGLCVTIVAIGTRQTLTRDNLNGLFRLSMELGIPLRINLFMPTLGDFQFVPSLKSIHQAITLLIRSGCAVRASDRLFGSLLKCYKPGVHFTAGRSCRILPTGHVTPSTYLITSPWLVEKPLADLELQDLSKEEPFQHFGSKLVPESCAGCELIGACRGGSTERRWLWYQTMSRRDPFCPRNTRGDDGALEWPDGLHSSAEWTGPLIHLDYLPTIIAIPPNCMCEQSMKQTDTIFNSAEEIHDYISSTGD